MGEDEIFMDISYTSTVLESVYKPEYASCINRSGKLDKFQFFKHRHQLSYVSDTPWFSTFFH